MQAGLCGPASCAQPGSNTDARTTAASAACWRMSAHGKPVRLPHTPDADLPHRLVRDHTEARGAKPVAGPVSDSLLLLPLPGRGAGAGAGQAAANQRHAHTLAAASRMLVPTVAAVQTASAQRVCTCGMAAAAASTASTASATSTASTASAASAAVGVVCILG